MPFQEIGSTWGKWDLHFHTPSSYDYSNKSLTNEAIIEGLKAAGVVVVAITDHHRMDVQRIKALQALGKGEVTVLPGIEFRSELGGKEKVHFIGIFSEDADLDDLWTKLSGKLGVTAVDVKNKGDDNIYVTFTAAAQIIHEHGGIVTTHAGGKSNSIENISNTSFKMAYKADLARDHIDIFELGKPSDRAVYEDKVFPAIGHTMPLIMGSDNHNITEYKPKAFCWIKGDTSFRTFQQLVSDPHRAYVGEEPPELTRTHANPTKYIKSIGFQKVANSTLTEDWFGGAVPINSGFFGTR